MNRPFVGIILAGGKSRRFGKDKALAEVGGRSMIEHAVSLMRLLGMDPCIVTAPSRDYRFTSCRIEADIFPDRGPLAGLCTACRLFPARRLLVLTCDMPGLDVQTLRRLIQCHDPRSTATVFRTSAELVHPFPGIYEASLAGEILRHLHAGQSSMKGFLAGLSRVRFISAGPASLSLTNINDEKTWQQFKVKVAGRV
ncbi:MAG: molybdenum cofactor guanylyltransferase [Candidatus Omnitrophota bacterium]|nr:molybdenum cofactor guanylyltransferase [Candidatus Omnitrophota bacterium]